jgi:hypothetical protein
MSGLTPQPPLSIQELMGSKRQPDQGVRAELQGDFSLFLHQILCDLCVESLFVFYRRVQASQRAEGKT